MRNVCLKTLVMALTVICLAATANRLQAQLVQTHIQFTNLWKYDRSGAELGAAWRTNNFNDSAWPSGLGLLGNEVDTPGLYTIHAPILTPFGNPLSTTVTTYYFRTTFTFTGTTNIPGFALIATNLVDDGCAIWLNGRLAGGVRRPATFNATTTFAGPATEGQLDAVTLTNFLRPGQVNTLAVEVHQSGNTSSDMMFGLKLLSFTPTALQITSQPQSQTVAVSDPVTFSVEVSGGPATYRWFKDGALQSSTSNELRIASAQAVHAGNYHVVVSNALGAVTSTTATLTVTADTDGPKLVEAIINNVPGGGGSPFGSNTINVIFNEPLNSASARSNINYRLISATNSNIQVPILNILYSTALGALLNVDGSNANWDPDGQYYLLVNNVADQRGNHIAPNSVIGVSILITTNFAQIEDQWDFYSIAVFDATYPDIYRNTTNPWYGTNYVVDFSSGLWGTGGGILYIDPNPPPGRVCDGATPATLISYQNDPTLFRRKFTLPAGLPTSGSLRFRFLYDDGIVIYLNGKEIHRRNMPAGTLDENSKAITTVTDFGCVTNLTLDVTGLHVGRGNVLGTNVIAAAVYQSTTPQSDTWFGLAMDLVTTRTAQAPTNRLPAPTIVRNHINTPQGRKFVLSWPATNYGYNLMYSTAIAGTGSRPDRNWYTNEANWTQVSDQSNPYTNTIPPTTGPRRFYKLFREKLN